MILHWKMPFRFARSMYHAAIYRIEGKPVIAPGTIQTHRRDKCRVCPYKQLFQCAKCGCAIDLKVMLSHESCPDDPPRWSPVGPAPDFDEV